MKIVMHNFPQFQGLQMNYKTFTYMQKVVRDFRLSSSMTLSMTSSNIDNFGDDRCKRKLAVSNFQDMVALSTVKISIFVGIKIKMSMFCFCVEKVPKETEQRFLRHFMKIFGSKYI